MIILFEKVGNYIIINNKVVFLVVVSNNVNNVFKKIDIWKNVKNFILL